MNIPIPQSTDDIYNYGFDRNLNRSADTKSFDDNFNSSFTSRPLLIGTGSSLYKVDDKGLSLGGSAWDNSPFRVSLSGSLTATDLTLTGGTVKYGKTSFTDTVNAGYHISSSGAYFGAANDSSKLKYTVADGTFDLIGTISSRSTLTIASAINSSGNFVNDIINARMDSATKKILSDFNFGAVDYAGAVKSGDITWNTTTGALTGGTGVVVYRKGILGASGGVSKFTLDAETGDATFSGALSAATGTFSGSLTVGTALDTAVQANLPSDVNLVGYWSFDEKNGIIAYDSSGNNNNGTLNGSMTDSNFVVGISGTALDFDGVNEYVDITTEPWADNVNAVSVSVWFKVAGGAGTRRFIFETTPSFSLGLEVAADNTVKAWGRTDLGDTLSIASGFTPTIGTWYHALIVHDATGGITFKLYINNVLYEGAVITRVLWGTDGLHIGTFRDANDRFFLGTIDEFRVYNTALTAKEVYALYKNPAGNKGYDFLSRASVPSDTNLVAYWNFDEGKGTTANDASGNGNTGTLTNMEDADWVAGVVGTALDFDGVNEYVSVADSTSLSFGNGTTDTPFSISAWIYMDDATNFPIISKYTNPATREFYFVSHGDDDTLRVVLLDESADTWIGRKTAAVTAYEGQWIHVVVTYDASETSAGVKIYINGVQSDIADNANGSYTAMENTSSIFAIGYDGSTYANGKLDEVRIYSAALTAKEVYALYKNPAGNKGVTVPTGRLTSGSIYSKQITLAVADGTGDSYIAAGKTDFDNTQNGFILGIDDSDSNKAKFYIGDSTKYLNWDGSAFTLAGTYNTLNGNLFLGTGAGANIAVNGIDNTCLGYQSGNSLTSGDYNVFIGYQTGKSCVTSGFNVYVGYQAGILATGTPNTLIGYQAGVALTSGYNNTLVGKTAGGALTTGVYNTIIGELSGLNLAEGAVGGYNVIIGSYAARKIGSGDYNIIIGESANGSAGTPVSSVDECTIVGREAGYSNGGDGNTYIGYGAGWTNTSGTYNVALGYQAGWWETGSSKLFIDNIQRTNQSDGRVKALIYGVFASTTASQLLRFNSTVVIGGDAALATNATDEFLYIPTCAGTPTGTPTAYTGKVPLIYDTSNNYLYIYNGGWKKTTQFA